MGMRETFRSGHAPSAGLQAVPASCPDFSGETQLRRGIAVIFLVNVAWGLLPLFWKQGVHVPPVEVLCHRSLWGFILVFGLLWFRGGLSEVTDIVRNRRYLLFMIGCSLSHTFNWGFYIWAVGSGRVIDAALGHYMLPVFNVLAGFVVFRERPRRLQWAAICLAVFGVLGMIVMYGAFPWVGLTIAFNSMLFASFRKNAPVNAMPGLVVELLISAPLLWGYLLYLHATGQGTFFSVNLTQDLWLIGAGIATIIPQLGYAYSLCRVPLTTIALMQYITPTGNFLIGLLVFGEPFTPDKAFGFVCIWTALIVFTVESVMFRRSVVRASGKKGGVL